MSLCNICLISKFISSVSFFWMSYTKAIIFPYQQDGVSINFNIKHDLIILVIMFPLFQSSTWIMLSLFLILSLFLSFMFYLFLLGSVNCYWSTIPSASISSKVINPMIYIFKPSLCLVGHMNVNHLCYFALDKFPFNSY